MLKSIWIVVAIITQFIAVAMWGEYVWMHRLSNGGVGGTPLGQIQPIIWWLLAVEILALILIAYFHKQKNNL
ncbi:hypothetical protein NCCP2716_28470 [Sporosarcina sp. NCCP-2716]|uniref:hypothetical protein n=1 Tax=Sporosarcina sp. NCCP-2716 TaxID=2943679 RepID=UPI00203A6E29|nr:hypothetical protein [Sporosarcina sp. NCCP-2716]GKV70349.1 hypothetical protein NCCP2716_28470 [Sporosarcina sp. NCCP-2716]